MFRILCLFVALAFAYGQTTEGQSSEYQIVDRTNPDRVYLKKDGEYISLWHDIPMFADQANKIYNMMVEIPRGFPDFEEVNR